MRKKTGFVALFLGLALLMGGCNALSFGNVNEMLRAPALGEEYGLVQKAIASHLKEEPEYKYPREGSQRSPLLMVDLNGDGEDECVAFYTTAERGSTVYIAVLERYGEEWVVRFEMEGKGTELASVSVANLYGVQGAQLVVGYGNASLTQKFLAVYDYLDDTLSQTTIPGQYDRYLLDDFTGKEQSDLVVVTRGDGALALHFLTYQEGRLDYTQSVVELVSTFASCVSMHTSVSAQGERYLVIDGYIEQTGYLGTQVLVYAEGEPGRFYIREADSAGQIAAVNDTLRANRLLTSRDIGGGGVVVTPIRASGMGTNAIEEGLELEFIHWVDFTSEEPRVRYLSLFDSYHSLSVQLPQSWRGGIEVVAGEQDGSWQVRRRESGEVLLQLLDDPEGGAPEGAEFITGTQNSYILVSSELSTAENWAIHITTLA